PPPVATCACWPPPAASGAGTLPLHDALPISAQLAVPDPAGGDARAVRAVGTGERRGALPQRFRRRSGNAGPAALGPAADAGRRPDRKSTRLNSSHVKISYAVVSLKKRTAGRP